MSTISDAELHEIVQRVLERTMKGAGGVPEPVTRTNPGEAASQAPTTTADEPASPSNRSVALGADHGGFALKEYLKLFIKEAGYQVEDCGTYSSDSVDYPDFAYEVALRVSRGQAWRGIIVDGAGIGSCMAANKVRGVRAAMCYDIATAVNSREHNNANVLTLGGGMISIDMARKIVTTWLNTKFGGGRHARRVNKIMEIENKSA